MTWPSWSVTTPGTRNMPPGPAFAYAFDLWQYTNTGTVAGISGNVDLDLWFPPLVED